MWSILLYGAETQSLKKKDMKRLEAYEMWFWRKISKIKWTEKKPNEEILTDIEEERSLMNIIVTRKKKWTYRTYPKRKQPSKIEGQMKGRKIRGRPRTGMLDLLKGTSKKVIQI